MALRLNAAARTDPGLQREQNEDAYHMEMPDDPARGTGLFIVADGMGGYHAGEVASRLAVESIRDAIQPLLAPMSAQSTVRLNRRKRGRGAEGHARDEKGEAAQAVTAAQATNGASAESVQAAAEDAREDAEDQVQAAGATRQLSETLAVEHYGERLREAIERSSEIIVRYGKDHSDARGLGSTVTAALVVDGRAYIANVGDSRTYLLRDHRLQRITRDHSLVARLVEAGQIEPDEVYDHPNRNLIYRSLGAGKAEVEVDIFTETLQLGDILLLCSDGLWEMVRDPEIEAVLEETRSLDEACEQLIERANENGGEDNITAILMRCDEG
jgi:PPM family protein phosphatase